MKRLVTYQTPILSNDLEGKIDDSIQSFLHRGQWKEWGLDKIREQGAAILLHGIPGCLVGSTRIVCKRGNRSGGREITLRNLYLNFNNLSEGKGYRPIKGNVFLHSYDPELEIVRYNRIVNVLNSGRKEVYRLTTTQGIVEGTIDHPILLEDGSFKELGKLTEGETLLTKGSMKSLYSTGKGLRKETADVLKIDSIRQQMTYDVQMESPANNFVVNDGVIVHNTGKTITAYYLGKKLHLRVVEISMADYGSHIPGELARNIKKIFNGELIVAKQENKQPPIILLDECDAMIISRKKLGPDAMWMLEPINALLSEISKYPGLIVLATNLAPMLDEALERRLIAKIRFDKPDKEVRYRIWQAKWPEKFPVQPEEEELWELAEFDLTGAQIENAFLLWASSCIKTKVSPTIEMLVEFLQKRWRTYFES